MRDCSCQATSVQSDTLDEGDGDGGGKGDRCAAGRGTQKRTNDVCTKAKRRWNRRRAHEAGAGKGGFRLIVVCCFNGLEAKSRTNAIRRRALGQEHQQQSSTKNQAVPAEPSGRIPGTESTPQAQRQHKSLPDPKTTLRPSFALAQSIRGRPSRAITPQPTFISRRSPAHQPPIRSPSHFKHASCHS